VDASRHLNILLNADIFSGRDVGANAKLLLKFVRHAEKLNEQANSVRMAGFASARDPRLQIMSQSAFGEPWGSTYDLGLPTAPDALGKIYSKNAMLKPMRHSLQLRKEAPFPGRRQPKGG